MALLVLVNVAGIVFGSVVRVLRFRHNDWMLVSRNNENERRFDK